MPKLTQSKTIALSNYWYYFNPSKSNLEEAFFKIIEDSFKPKNEWKVIKVVMQIEKGIPLKMDSLLVMNRTSLGIHEISMSTLYIRYLKKHQIHNTMEISTKAEFDAAYNKFFNK